MCDSKETSERFELAERSIDLWPIKLSGSDLELAVFEKLIDAEEAAKAARFRFDHLRRSYILAHGALRLLLRHYLGVEAPTVRLSTGFRGKPNLDPPGPVRFNLSHSDTVALLGFTLDCDIGVDLEKVRAVPDMLHIAERYFCSEETAELLSLPIGERDAGFFRCWTRKEAYLKAVGDGLHEPLDSFRVSLLPGVPARFIHIKGSAQDASTWTLHDIDSIPHYSAAVAYRDPPRTLRVRPVTSPGELLA